MAGVSQTTLSNAFSDDLSIYLSNNAYHLRGFQNVYLLLFCILLYNVIISIKISLKFVPKVRINNIPTLVQIMAWRRPGDKPLSGPMMVFIADAYMCHSASMT